MEEIERETLGDKKPATGAVYEQDRVTTLRWYTTKEVSWRGLTIVACCWSDWVRGRKEEEMVEEDKEGLRVGPEQGEV